MTYDFRAIEARWQRLWDEHHTFRADVDPVACPDRRTDYRTDRRTDPGHRGQRNRRSRRLLPTTHTLDIAIAESIAGRVNLLAHGGIAMCGGRDFDRILFDNVVKPWLLENFDLPEDLAANPQFKSLLRMATWATEKAKIELSQKEEAVVSLPETELGVRDQSGEEIYIDIAVDRKRYDGLIASKLEESIQSARETLEKAGLSPHDVERVVFVGGPTHYKPLRDRRVAQGRKRRVDQVQAMGR